MAYKIGKLVKEQMEVLEAVRSLELVGFDEQSRKGYIQLSRYILDLRISNNAKLLYAFLLDFAWNNNFCWPGQEKLAKCMNLGRMQINRLTGELEKAGLVGIKRRGLGKTNLYRLYAKAKKA